MKKKGFTLIELLAVIVVLAIIAFIAIPVILGVVDKAKVGAAKSSALGYIDAVEKYIAISQIDKTKKKLEPGIYQVSKDIEVSLIDYIVPKVYAEDDTIYLNDIITMKGDKPSKGWVQISNKKVENYSIISDGFVVTKDKKIVKGNTPVDPSEIGGESGTSNVWTYNDEDGDGTKNVGDKITFGTESFYIISTDETNIKALAEYNLYVGGIYDTSNSNWTEYGTEATGLQNNTMLGYVYGQTERIGTTPFSSDSQKGTNYNDYTGSIVEMYVNNYKTKLEELGTTISSATLITKEELVNLGCSPSGYTCSAAPSWVKTTSYWSSSTYNIDCVWIVYSNRESYDFNMSNFIYAFDNSFGVRPVITIPKSAIN